MDTEVMYMLGTIVGWLNTNLPGRQLMCIVVEHTMPW